jgi:predicted ATP-grasp superfamily ATP-dependent carboligase
MVDVSTPVVVLSAKTHGSLGIIRTLGRLGVPVYAVDSAARGPGAYSRYLRQRSIIEIGAVSDDALVDHLLRVGRALGTRAVLIPTWDETSLLASDHYERLSERFILPHQPDGLARRLSDKRTMAALAREHGVPSPDIVVPQDLEAVAAFADTAVFPVMLKGIDGNRLFSRTGRKMVIVGDRAELLRLYAEMEDPDDPNLMLQEYIPGGDDTVWMFNGYFDASSEALIGITGRKLRQTPVYTGATSLGIVLPNDEVDATTRRWMRELGYRGVLDIGYRYDARDGRYKVLDVNPRVGATFRLFVDRNGLDVVRALYLDLTGQPVVAAEPRWGRKWIVEKDLASSWRYWRDGKLGIGAWLGSFRGVEEAGYFAPDDLRPFGHAVRNLLLRRGVSTGGVERM